jgi:hypothetical protein
MTFKTGDQVKFVTPSIEGQIVGATVDSESTLLLLVEYQANGQTQQRYFKADQLEAV